MHDHQVKAGVTRRDNKVRLSQDVLEKADRIAAEWGLKNARAAVEAVFRRYCDDYLQGRSSGVVSAMDSAASSAYLAREDGLHSYGEAHAAAKRSSPPAPKCEALDALDQLLAL